MPIAKEFTIRQEDKPGTLGKLCQALADQNVNILAFQSFPSEKGKSSIHLVLDNHTAAKAVLDQQRADYTETEVAPALTFIGLIGAALTVALRRGGLLLAILVLPLTVPILIFGVADAGKAAKVLELTAAAGATT